MSCRACMQTPELRQEWGCDAPSEEAVAQVSDWGMQGNEVFYSCPRLFIPESLWEFKKRYNWQDKGPIDAQSARYLEAHGRFENYLWEAIEEKRRRNPKLNR